MTGETNAKWHDYDVEARFPNRDAGNERFVALSNVLRATRPDFLDLSYGDHARERIDFFPCGKRDAPLILFIHGGYWRAGDKARRVFPAELFNRAGVSWGALGYPLAPEASLASMVESVRRAVAWIAAHAAEVDCAGAKVTLCGHSAGAHLATLAATNRQTAANLHGLVLISGLYDLRPLVDLPINVDLKLDVQQAAALSPMMLPVPDLPRIVAWAIDDTAPFIEQGHRYVAARPERTEELEIRGRDHFSVLEELAIEDSALVRSMMKLASL